MRTWADILFYRAVRWRGHITLSLMPIMFGFMGALRAGSTPLENPNSIFPQPLEVILIKLPKRVGKNNLGACCVACKSWPDIAAVGRKLLPSTYDEIGPNCMIYVME